LNEYWLLGGMSVEESDTNTAGFGGAEQRSEPGDGKTDKVCE
jgi:hypothetical protein